MNRSRKQSSTNYPMNFFMALADDHITGAEELTPSVTISKNGGSFTSPEGAVTEIGNGWYSLSGDADDRSTLGEFLLHAEATGADPADEKYTIESHDPFNLAEPGDEMSLTSTYDAAKNAASAGAKMDLIDAPNATAVSALQSGLATSTNVSEAQTAIISAVNAATPDIDFPTAVEIRQEIDGNSTKLTSILAAVVSTAGEGAIAYPYVLTDDETSSPIAGVDVSVSSDVAGTVIVASGTTDINGSVTFNLNAGTYYFWREHPNYTFIDPDVEVVS